LYVPAKAAMPLARPALSRRFWRWPVLLRAMEALLLLGLIGLIFHDRLALARRFFFVYGDEDQTLLWYAAQDLLHGRIPEPCFYGQAFSSCLEAYLAVPLLWAKMPPWSALPAVTIFLGLLPFLMMALAAWRHQRPALAGLALLIPVALPVRYAMLTGMPRGFVTGIALAIFPCLWLLDAPSNHSLPLKPRRLPRLWHDAVRFFGLGLLSVLALTINPNCSLLLAGALAFALATRLRQAAFWLYASLGALVGSLYPLGIFFFYYKLHDDYRLYHREGQLTWSYAGFREFGQQLAVPFWDFVPIDLSYSVTGWFLGVCFTAVLIYLLLTRRFAAALATLAAVAFTLFSLGFARVHEGRSSVFFGYGRMYLALPVLPPLLLLWGSPRPKRPLCPDGGMARSSTGSSDTAPAAAAAGSVSPSGVTRHPRRLWLARLGLVVCCGAGVLAVHAHARQRPAVIAREVQNVQMVELITLVDGWDLAQALQSAADSQKADVVLLVGNQKRWTYLLPVLTHCQTLYPAYERRTWRLVEESLPRHERVLVLDQGLFDKARRAGYGHAAVVCSAPFIGVFDTNGQSLIRLCQTLNVPLRGFHAPANADLAR
jgi:hypothetical protein